MSDDQNNVNQPLVDSLVDKPAPKAPGGSTPGVGASRNEADEILKEIFSNNPTIAAAALQKAAARAGITEAQLAQMTQKPADQPAAKVEEDDDEDVDEVEVLRRAMAQDRVDNLMERLEVGVEKVVSSKEVNELAEAHKRIHGEKADPDFTKKLRQRIEDAVVDKFSRAQNGGQKIDKAALDKIVQAAKDSVLGFTRQVIGDPSGLGRQASGTPVVSNLRFSEEAKRMPTLEEARKDPKGALAAARAANTNALAEHLAKLRSGGGTSKA